jgi:phosphoribosylaminoimidazolecarboxamide formyltransferase / IMP cyclohydrolase
MLRKIHRALFSVSDKTGLVPFAAELHAKYGVELIATGGTKTALAAAGLPVKDVADLTGFPEILDGRVKTLHPAIYAGLLAKRDKPEHLATLVEHGLLEIDLVVCNLYPFEKTVAQPGVTEAEAIENIDIGGPCMIRAAAKNFAAVTVLVPSTEMDYQALAQSLSLSGGHTDLEQRRALAADAFSAVADYDRAIAEYFQNVEIDSDLDDLDGDEQYDEHGYPYDLTLDYQLKSSLRYGENPHQKAALYIGTLTRACAVTAVQLHGKELSYNNYLDLDAALSLVRELSAPAAVVIKHNNPCGAATGNSLAAAFESAWNGDPLSAFGGVLAFNTEVDAATAHTIMAGERFVECVIAPSFDTNALNLLLGWKKNVRLLSAGKLDGQLLPSNDRGPRAHYRYIDGGLLMQEWDDFPIDSTQWQVKTHRPPSDTELQSLRFAWLVCKHVKSNAIVLANTTQQLSCTTGVGAGQMSRVESVRIAIRKAGERARGSVLASDAFFPFPDNVELAAEAGITAIIQPGGSIKDADSIAACDRHGIAMLFTGVRHFRH